MYISRYAENHASINVCIPTLNSVLDLSSGHPALLPFQTFNNGKIQHQENEDEKDDLTVVHRASSNRQVIGVQGAPPPPPGHNAGPPPPPPPPGGIGVRMRGAPPRPPPPPPLPG